MGRKSYNSPMVFSIIPRKAANSLKQFSHRLSGRALKHLPGLPGPLAEWIPLLVLVFLIGVGIAGWLTQRVIRTDKQEAYHYNDPISVDSPAFRRSAAIVGFPIVAGNRATLLNNGDAIFPAMRHDISGAKKSVNLETFIIKSDKAGGPIIEALADAARRGVQVRLLFDAI